MSEDMPEDMPDRMPNRMPDRMPDRMPEEMSEYMPEDMPDRMPDNMPEDMPDRMSDRMPEDLPDRMPEDLPEDMPEDMSEYMPEDMSDRMPEDMSEYMPEDMPDWMPEDMSDRMPEDMPDRMPEDLPDRMPDRMPGDMPEDMPDHMPEDMPDRMPNRMSEDMSDRMPEDLPVRKCKNAMVGITRSKVIIILCSLKNLQPRYPYYLDPFSSISQLEMPVSKWHFTLTKNPRSWGKMLLQKAPQSEQLSEQSCSVPMMYSLTAKPQLWSGAIYNREVYDALEKRGAWVGRLRQPGPDTFGLMAGLGGQHWRIDFTRSFTLTIWIYLTDDSYILLSQLITQSMPVPIFWRLGSCHLPRRSSLGTFRIGQEGCWSQHG